MATSRVRGILMDSEGIILIKRVIADGIYYVFPGGGVEVGEDLKQALKREIKEELGVEVEVEKLFFTQPHEKNALQTEYFYECTMVGGVLGTGQGPEFQPDHAYEGSHEIVKISLDSLKRLRVLPYSVRDLVYLRHKSPGQ